MSNSGRLRFTGRAFEIEGKWKWTMWVRILGSNEIIEEFESQDEYPTKQEAIAALYKFAKGCNEALAKTKPGIDPDLYIDLKTNELRKFDNSDRH